MPTPAPTRWPLRQALNFALRHILVTQALPSVNPDIAARLISADASKIPQFGDAQTVVGDVAVPGEPTLCIVGIARRNAEIAAGQYQATLTTQIRLKTPFVADNAPEDFAFLMSLLEDNLEDVFTSLANRTITPTNPANGHPLLPAGASFFECTSLGSNAMNWPVRSGDGVTTYAGWMLMHSATFQYALSRPGVVGSS